MAKTDLAKRKKLASTILALMKGTGGANENLGFLDPEKVRSKEPALAKILDEFIMSKSWRTDPGTTAKQIAEALVAKDQSSNLSTLLSGLEARLSEKPKKPKKKK